MSNALKTILSLCDYSGRWSQPYEEAGYNVVRVDIKHGGDIRLLEYQDRRIYGILAAPPCTHLANSGARWWQEKGEAALLEALSVADACARAALIYRPAFWVMENPIGRLKKFYGPPRFSFDPCEYGDLADEPKEEAYTKRTLLWGDFVIPSPLLVGNVAVEPVLGSKMHLLPPSAERATLRSLTPTGFARAFFMANQ
jgi:hypothetical protein